MLRILLGRARTGKSARVLEEIRALGDSSQQILLVPEHASHVAEVDVCRACGVTVSSRTRASVCRAATEDGRTSSARRR